MMGIVVPETRWACKKRNKITSGICLVFYSSVITMMHGPTNIKYYVRYIYIYIYSFYFKGIGQGWTNSKRQVAQATKFCTVTHTICGST